MCIHDITLLLCSFLLDLPHRHTLFSHSLILLKGILRDLKARQYISQTSHRILHLSPCILAGSTYLIQPNCRLIRILHKHELALRRLCPHHHVYERTDDCPAVVQVEIHLRRKFARLVAQHAEDDVIRGVARAGAGDEARTRGLAERYFWGSMVL